jgi:hypothetical protein
MTLFLLLLLAQTPAPTPPPEGALLSLREAVDLARAHSPLAAAARVRAEGADRAADVAGGLADPTVDLAVENWRPWASDFDASTELDVFAVAVQPRRRQRGGGRAAACPAAGAAGDGGALPRGAPRARPGGRAHGPGREPRLDGRRHGAARGGGVRGGGGPPALPGRGREGGEPPDPGHHRARPGGGRPRRPRRASRRPPDPRNARSLQARLLRLDEDLVRPAEDARRSAVAAFAEGAVDVLRVVDAERMHAEARGEALDLTVEAFLTSCRARFAAGLEALP